jgi:hypothetical protein
MADPDVVPIATVGLHCGRAWPGLWSPHRLRRPDRNGRAPLRRVPPLSVGSPTATLRLPSFGFAPQHCLVAPSLRRSVAPSLRRSVGGSIAAWHSSRKRRRSRSSRSADPSAAPLRRLEPELLENGHRVAPPTPRASERPASYEFCDTAFGGLGWSAYVYTDPGLIVVFDRAQAAGSCGIWTRPCRSLRWLPRRRSPPRRGPACAAPGPAAPVR